MAASPLSFPVTFHPPEPADDSFSDVYFGVDTPWATAGTPLPGWCIRLDVLINPGMPYTGYVYSSYETLGLSANLPATYVDNLDNVNWLLNYYRGGATGYTATDVQTAIWQLMHQMDDVPNTALTELALANDGYVPDAGETLAVIIDPVRADGTHDQTSIVETQAAKLGDRVWEDANADGIQDAGEAGIAGATVHLVRDIDGDGKFTAPGEVLASTTTDANGNYSFKGLTPGFSYQVQFVAPAGYDAASARQVDGSGGSGANSDGQLSDVIVLQPGEYNATIDSGYYRYASIGDRAWTDTNGNGVQDAGEAGQAGVKVRLYTCVDGAPGALVATQTTDADGNYNFANLKPGDYMLKFVASDGSVLTTANVGNDALDSDAGAKGLTGCYTLGSGEHNTSVDAGFYRGASLGDRVWNDVNANGVQDEGETGLGGIKVQLYTCVDGAPGTLVGTKSTDANGNYSFAKLQPGDYMVKFVAPNGSVLSTANVGSDAFDSDAGADGFTGCYTLVSGENNTTVDAGIYKTASLGDKVWHDLNANGVQDAGEGGKSGVTVELYACVDGQPGELVASKVTGSSGVYNFTGLKPGDYMVKFIAADGSVLSTANVGDDAFDSDAGADGFSGCYTLAAGEKNTTADAGFYKTASLGDKVWNDTNGNGIQNAQESGKAGVTVELYTCVNDAPGVLVATQVTDAAGNYNFTGLKPGDYVVKFIAADGSVLTTANVGTNDGTDSDADAGGLTGCYSLTSGQTNKTVDAGFVKPVPPASLGDRVWNDSNANGVQDAGESGKAGVQVQLYTCVDGAPGLLVGITTTDANGNYGFFDLKPGDYVVQFIATDGSVLSTASVGSDALDSDAGTNGFTGCYTLVSGETNNTVDAGYYKTASLGDRAWTDSNGNGVQDAGEAGKAGVTAELYTCVDDAPGTLVATQTTDANGNYGFDGLKPGDYMVKFIANDGTVLSTANVGNDALDSDAGSNGFTGCYTLASGENNSTVDAGFRPRASIVNPDQAQVCEDRSTSFNVLANDFGDGLELVGVSHETAALQSEFVSRGGALSFTADGQVSYKTMTNYYGNDKLVYTVEDAAGNRSTQTVDVTVNPISDAPIANGGAAYHPGGWENIYSVGGVMHWVHGYTLADFGTISDSADQLQQFGDYNVGVADDVDTLQAVVVSGLQGATAAYADIVYDGQVLDFSQGQKYTISVADINAGKLDLDFRNAYQVYALSWQMQDSGTVANPYCYAGSNLSNTGTTSISTPVALDLNGDGQIGVTGATASSQKDASAVIGHTVQFDIDADGTLDTIEWFDGSGDGILIDNRDGGAAAHMDGSRLFGNQGGHADGYAKLRQFDANGDGQISGSELAGIELWVDDGDAVVQDGELQSLAQHGIVALSTEVSLAVDAESRVHLQSSATRADGSTLMSEDVFFLQALPEPADLLSTDTSLDALLGAAATTDAGAAMPGDVTDVTQAAELLRKLSAQMEAHAAV